jgi:hypothetical protein
MEVEPANGQGVFAAADRFSIPRPSRECVDIFHLHNATADASDRDALSVRQVFDDVVPAFERLRLRRGS